MRRGDIILTAPAGDYGKARPAVVVQSDMLSDTDSVLISLMSSANLNAPISRITVEPSPSNGLRLPTQIMIEKIIAVPRGKCSPPIGRLTAEQVASLNDALFFVLGLAD